MIQTRTLFAFLTPLFDAPYVLMFSAFSLIELSSQRPDTIFHDPVAICHEPLELLKKLSPGRDMTDGFLDLTLFQR